MSLTNKKILKEPLKEKKNVTRSKWELKQVKSNEIAVMFFLNLLCPFLNPNTNTCPQCHLLLSEDVTDDCFYWLMIDLSTECLCILIINILWICCMYVSGKTDTVAHSISFAFRSRLHENYISDVKEKGVWNIRDNLFYMLCSMIC